MHFTGSEGGDRRRSERALPRRHQQRHRREPLSTRRQGQPAAAVILRQADFLRLRVCPTRGEKGRSEAVSDDRRRRGQGGTGSSSSSCSPQPRRSRSRRRGVQSPPQQQSPASDQGRKTNRAAPATRQADRDGRVADVSCSWSSWQPGARPQQREEVLGASSEDGGAPKEVRRVSGESCAGRMYVLREEAVRRVCVELRDEARKGALSWLCAVFDTNV